MSACERGVSCRWSAEWKVVRLLCSPAPAPMAFLLFRANPPGVLSILDLIIEPMADANLHTLPGF